LTAGAASLSTTLNEPSKSVRIVNVGENIAYVRIGRGAQTATTADMPVRALSSIIVTKGQEEDTLAYISALGTTLHAQCGEGGM
jgi:hypothetical protein